MIELSRINDATFAQALKTVGAFAWWYVDLTTPAGDGLVLVWALGLPFLPSSRAFRSPPYRRPSIHLASYRGGQPDLYLLQEYEADSPSCQVSGSGQIGACRFEVSEHEGETRLHVHLDLEVPSAQSRLLGEIDLRGHSLACASSEGRLRHVWTPRCLGAHAQAHIECGDQIRTISGRGYFDGNLSALPLHEQNIESWRWGRTSFEDETVVYYDVTSEDGERQGLVLIHHADGHMETHTQLPTFSRPLAGNYGLRGPRRVLIERPNRLYELDATHLVDDGPFYQRYLVTGNRIIKNSRNAVVENTLGHGIAELVRPGAIDRPWQRPFVRMKTHKVAAGHINSTFLPLFSGFADDRAERLARALTGWRRS